MADVVHASTLIGLPLLAPRDNAGTHVREQPGDMMPVRDGSSVARTSPALVGTARQISYVSEPLPRGMWLNNDSGKETVTIAGLVEGTELSQGTSPLRERLRDAAFDAGIRG